MYGWHETGEGCVGGMRQAMGVWMACDRLGVCGWHEKGEGCVDGMRQARAVWMA